MLLLIAIFSVVIFIHLLRIDGLRSSARGFSPPCLADTLLFIHLFRIDGMRSNVWKKNFPYTPDLVRMVSSESRS